MLGMTFRPYGAPYCRQPVGMTHLAFDSVSEFRNKQKHYAELSKKKRNLIKAFVSPIWTFVRIYLLRLGILQGWRGLVIASVYAQYTFWKYYR